MTSNTYTLHTQQVIKGMSKHRGRCEASIARVYSEHVVGGESLVDPGPVSEETGVIGRSKRYTIRNPNIHRLIVDIVTRETGECPHPRRFREYKRAQIGGKQFTSNESLRGVRRVCEKMFRCGSVVTMTTGGRNHGGRSIYGWVKRFISYDLVDMAEIRWLPIPEYPTGLPVVVRLGFGNPRPVQPPIVMLEDIDPSPVSLLNDDDNNSMYVIRMTGIDTM